MIELHGKRERRIWDSAFAAATIRIFYDKRLEMQDSLHRQMVRQHRIGVEDATVGAERLSDVANEAAFVADTAVYCLREHQSKEQKRD